MRDVMTKQNLIGEQRADQWSLVLARCSLKYSLKYALEISNGFRLIDQAIRYGFLHE